MALSNTEYLLQQILNSSDKTNDNLTAMRDLLSDMAKAQKKSGNNNNGSGNNGNGNNNNGNNGNGGRRNPPTPPSGSNDAMKKIFNNIFGEMKNVSTSMVGAGGSVQNVVGSMGTSAKVIGSAFSMIPGPVGAAASAFNAVVDAGMAVYNYLNDQLNLYNKISSAGINLAEGMLTTRDAAASAYMSINDFSTSISKNSDVVASMNAVYGNGVGHFADLMNSMQKLQVQNGLYGVSQQQLADLSAKNFKYQRMYMNSEQIRQMNESQTTDLFVRNMTNLSKSVGKSVDDLMGKFDSLSGNLDSSINLDALKRRYGLGDEMATAVDQASNEFYAGLGDFSKIFQKLMSSKNRLSSLPDGFEDQMTQLITDQFQQMQKRGVTDPALMQKEMQKYILSKKDDIIATYTSLYDMGNTEAAGLLDQMVKWANSVDTTTKKVDPAIEAFTNRFNTWISSTFVEPFNKLFAETQRQAASYLLDVANQSNGALDFMSIVIKDGYNYILNSFGGLFGSFGGIFGKLGQIILGDGFTGVQKSLNDFISTLTTLPIKLIEFVWDLFNGETEKAGKVLKDTVGSVYEKFTSVFEKLSDIKFSYSDMKSRIESSFESMKSKIGSWWDTAKGWFSNDTTGESSPPKPSETPSINSNINQQPIQSPTIQNTMRDQPVVQAAPSIKQPERIDEAKDNDQNMSNIPAPPPVQNPNDAIVQALKAIQSQAEQGNSVNTQIANLLRQIADNTTKERNL